MPLMPRRRHPGARRLAYSAVGLQVLLASIAAHALQIISQTTLPMLFIVNVTALFYLRLRATSFLRARRTDFDAVIAAEMIVAFGVLSLILGITSAVAPLFLGAVSLDVTDLRALAGVATPFLEGLATAGLAPFFAVLLRIEAHEAESAYDTGADFSDLSVATRDLSRELVATFKALEKMGKGLREVTDATNQLAFRIDVDLKKLDSAVSASEVKVAALAKAAEASSTQVAKLADETTHLNAAANEAGTLLNALGELIVSVERFVKPGTSSE